MRRRGGKRKLIVRTVRHVSLGMQIYVALSRKSCYMWYYLDDFEEVML